MPGIYAHGCVDDLDLGARSHWAGKSKISVLNYTKNYQAICIKPATRVGLFKKKIFLHDLDFVNVHMPGPPCFLLQENDRKCVNLYLHHVLRQVDFIFSVSC